MPDSEPTSHLSVATSADPSAGKAHSLTAPREAIDQARARVLAAPGNPKLRHDLAQALHAFGDALKASGDLTGAHGCYRDAVDAVREDASRLGDAGSLSVVSASLHNIGEVLVAQGDLAGAADALRRGLEIRRRLCEIDGNNSQRRRDVERSIERLGEVLILKSTLSGFHRPRQQNSASNGHPADDRLARLKAIGDELEARGDLAGALALFRECLEIQRNRAASKPGDAALFRDLSWTLAATARAHQAQGDLSSALAALSEAIAVRRALAAQSPTASMPRLDLSFSLMAMGEALDAKGDVAGALSSYEEAGELRRQLCTADPSNNGLRCDLAASLVKIGETLERKADRVGALNAYREALEIARQLSAHEPESAQWKLDLSRVQERIDAIIREA